MTTHPNFSRLAYNPRCGDIIALAWSSPDIPLVVCGNCLNESGKVWCMILSNGERYDAAVEEIVVQTHVPLNEVSEHCKGWAALGNSDAAWWLGWFFEGTNHRKSVWYYIAAIRKNRGLHGWALSRVFDDAHNPVMNEGYPEPELSFLSEIKEFVQLSEIKFGRWKDAVEQAEKHDS